MKPRSVLSYLVLFLSASILYAIPTGVNNATAHAASTAGLGIWNDQYGSNLTSLTGLGIGTTFTVKVNVTNAGQLGGFDVTVGYFLVVGPAILQEISDSISPGLFDGTGLASGCTALPPTINRPVALGQVRYSTVLQGSVTGTGQPCAVSGAGTLFSMTFKVLAVGATAIDIIQTTTQGKQGSTIVGPAPSISSIPYQPYDAYFKNAPGVPPVPIFTYNPSTPVVGDTVSFNGTQSYDPGATTSPYHGLDPEPIVYDSNGNGLYDSGEPVIVGVAPPANTRTCSIGSTGNCLKFDAHITYVDPGGLNHWVQGDSVVYDSIENGIYSGADFVITGPQVAANTALKTDPKLVFDEIHGKYFWDNGYIWDFGDGQTPVTGNSTLHEFISQTTQPAAGTFSVRLAVYDRDDHVPMRTIQLVTVSTGNVFDVAVSLSLSKDALSVGQDVGVSVTVSNRGNRNFSANLTVTYDYQGTTQIAFENGIRLSQGQSRLFSYTIATSPLPARVYTVTSKSRMTNATSADPTPIDDESAASFVLSVPADEPPIASFSFDPNNPTTGQTVSFDGTLSNDQDGSIQSWSWSFGDGFTISGPKPSHSYSSPGNYTVTLTVVDSSGLSASQTGIVHVQSASSDESPIASFTFSPTNPSTAETVFFNGSNSSDPDGFIISSSWLFGDGGQSFGSSFAQHSYFKAGNYTVTLTVNDSNGQFASTSKTVQVHARPLHDVAVERVSAYPQVVVATQTVNVQVVVENTGSSNETVSVTAYYGSNIIGTLNGVSLLAPCNFCSNYQYLQFLWDTSGVAPGNYTISATVFLPTDQSPSDNSITDGLVNVLPPPTLTITPTSGIPGAKVLVQGGNFPLNPYGNQGIGFIEVTFDDQLVGFTNSRNGSFNFTFSIPLSQGSHLIKALDEQSGAHASTGFQVLYPPSPGNLAVTVQVGTIYFPGETAVIYVQTTLNGVPVNTANVQLQLFRPNGSSVTLSTQPVAQGLFKASFLVPNSGSSGTYLIVVHAHVTTGPPLDAGSIKSFEVKPTWLSSQGHTLATGVAGVFLAGMVIVSWRRGYFRRKEDEPSLPF